MNKQPKKNKRLFFSLLILSLLLSSIRAEAASFRLLYNNDNMGELDGCG